MDIFDIADRVTAGIVPLDPEINFFPKDLDLGILSRQVQLKEAMRKHAEVEKRLSEQMAKALKAMSEVY